MKDKDWKIDPISLFSHELKTPLSSLQMGLELLEKDFEKYKELLPLIKSELKGIIEFITDNLDLRFIQEKKELLQPEWESFGKVLSKACSSFEFITQKENIRFDIKTDNKLDFEVFMDSEWIICLLKNLLSNAINFSPKNSTIFIEYGFKDKSSFICSIRDQGPGLDDNQKVFELFYKTAAKPKQGLKNTGLGLSIAKAIVTAQGGQISAFSEFQGKGSVFCFTLPKARILKQTA